MSLITLCLPKMGESVMEVMVLDWCIQEGERVMEGAPLLEVATDKVDAEIPAAYTGKVKALLVRKGEVVAIGAPIALLEVDHLAVPPLLDEPSFENSNLNTTHHLAASISALDPKKVKLSPLASYIAQANGIQRDELARLAGYNRDRRVTKQAILNHISQRLPMQAGSQESPLFSETITPLAGDEVLQMDRVRKLIADRMVQSKKISPHVTSFIRADVTELVAWREKHKTSFEAKYGAKLTYNPIFMAVIARVLQCFPLLNAVVSNNQIIKRKSINIGFAVARSDGNVLVPVVQQVAQLGLVALAQQINLLIDKARSGSIMPDALMGASYTISNIGCFDNLMGTPIIVQPQVAILALGLIEKRPAVVHINGKDSIAIRHELFLSHTYDHRIIDGAIGGGFLQYLAKALASFVDDIDSYPFT